MKKIRSEPETNTFNADRRRFLGRTTAGLITATTLSMLDAHRAQASEHRHGKRDCRPDGWGGRRHPYGEPRLSPNQNGELILALPPGFRYVTFSHVGSPMSDGNLTPKSLDGMAAFWGPDDCVRLIRNHELRNPPVNRTLAVEGPMQTRYDPLGVGGCVTVDFDPRSLKKGRRVPPVTREFVSLNGTIVNCAGGFAYRDVGWITCEETTDGPRQGWRQKHGYPYLVPVDADETVSAVPLRAMGRFWHEAAAADPVTGIVYQTEDSLQCGFYRFVPNKPRDLQAGGTLQILGIEGHPKYDARERQAVGARLKVRWYTISNPDPDLEAGAPNVFSQGRALGGALFTRLEGLFRGERRSFYFVSSTGGDAKRGTVNPDGFVQGYGQIWKYTPRADGAELQLVFESPGQSALDSPDNMCVTPSGSLLMCEGNPLGVTRLVGLTREGDAFPLAVNQISGTPAAFAGVCFSPDGDTLFVNLNILGFLVGQPDGGMTCAITGPWGEGPL